MKEGEGMMEENKQPQSIKMEIELHQDGQLSVKCPMLADTMFCLGLLEMTKATVFQYKANVSKSKIETPRGGIMNFVRRFNG
jgi:hypothetical protein